MFASVVLCDFQIASHAGCSSPGRVLKALGPREAAQLELHVTLLCMVEQPQSVATTFPNPCSLFTNGFCLCPV